MVQRRVNRSDGLAVVLRSPGECPAASSHGPRAHAMGVNSISLLPSRFFRITFTITDVAPPINLAPRVSENGADPCHPSARAGRAHPYLKRIVMRFSRPP